MRAVGDIVAAEFSSPEDSLVSAERAGIVRAAVDALPEKMRYIVSEIYFNDRTVKDLADELGTTHSAISQQRSEGIRLLRDGLETHYADAENAERRSCAQFAYRRIPPQRLPRPACADRRTRNRRWRRPPHPAVGVRCLIIVRMRKKLF